MLCCRAASRMRDIVGPSSGSAVAYHLGSCSAGKYGPWKISCRHEIWAPSAAALAISSTCFSIASSLGMFALHWMTAALTVVMSLETSLLGTTLSERRDQALAEAANHPLGIACPRRVDVEMVDPVG